LVPVRIENVAPTESLAYFMSTVHWLDALTPPIENHLHKLAESIKALLHVVSLDAAHPAGAMPAGLLDVTGKPAEPGAAAASASFAAGKPAKRGMFQELMNFSYQRTPLQAVGWYLMYLLIGLVIFAVVGRVTGLAGKTPDEAFTYGNIAGQLAAIPYHILL